MKIARNNEFVLREIAGESFLIPVGEASARFNGMITLNGMSAFLWKQLEAVITEEELVNAILETYEVEEAQAKEDLHAFLMRMKALEMIQEQE